VRSRHPPLRFVATNVVVWVAMVAILILLPDALERWVPLQVARVIGWCTGCSVWVVAVEPQWKARVGPIALFAVQFALWVSAALVAIWISEQASLN